MFCVEESETQDELLQRMEKLDKEKCEMEVKVAELKQKELELTSSLSLLHQQKEEKRKKKEMEAVKHEELLNEDPEVEYKRRLVERFTYKNTELIKRIYKENKARADAAHAKLFNLNYNGEDFKLPLYNQPSDLLLYHENIEKYKKFRPKLIKFLQLKRNAEIRLDSHMQKEYLEHKKCWLKRVEKLENNPKRRQRQQKNRQFYEREFPEIRKHREQQERFERLGSRSVGFIRSEAEVEEIVDNLREMDASEKQMHLMAIQTPYLLNKYERRIRYIDNNGLIQDVEQFRKEHNATAIWSEKEKEIFREKFALFPKDFEKIADFLELKCCSDCVLFYYRNKKKGNFKSSKSKSKKKGKLNRTGQMLMNKQKQTNKQEKDNVGESIVEDDDDSLLSDEESLTTTNIDLPISETAKQNKAASTEQSKHNKPADVAKQNKSVTSSEQLRPSNKFIASNETSKHNKVTTSSETIKQQRLSNENESQSIVLAVTETPKIKAQSQPLIKVFNTRSGKNFQKSVATPKQVSTELTVEESISITTESSNPPLKITIVVTSPSNTKSNTTSVSMASIVSETVTAAASLAEYTDNTSNEMLNKVEDLIRQHLNKMPEHNDPSRWSEHEMMKAVEGLKKYSRNWMSISKVVETKSEAQCKNFYFNYKKKFNLESILGILKVKEKEEQDEEDLVSYLEELERQEMLEKQKLELADKQEQSEKVNKTEHRGRVVRSRSISKPRLVEQQVKLVSEDKPPGTLAKVSENTPSPQEIEEIQTSIESKPVISSVTQKQDTSIFRSQLSIQSNIKPTPSFTTEAVVLRPPPPLTHIQSSLSSQFPPSVVVSSDKTIVSRGPVTEISLQGDVGIFKRTLDLSLNKENVLKESSMIPTADYNKDDVMHRYNAHDIFQELRLSPDTLNNVNRTAPKHFMPPFHQQIDRLLPRTPPAVPQVSVHAYNQFVARHPNVLEQNVAMQAFNTRAPGYMSTAHSKNQSDLPSPRFRFPGSPSPGAASLAHVMNASHIKHNQSIQPPVFSHLNAQVPAAININSAISPQSGAQQMLHSPITRQQFQNQFSPGPDEVQKIHEMLYRHQQEAMGMQQELGRRDIQHEIESDRELQMQLLQRQKYIHLKQLEFEQQRRQEAKLHEEQLLKRHFAQFEDLTPPQRKEIDSQLDILKFANDMPRRSDEYLRTLPMASRSRVEVQQRAASIPDLRTNLLTDPYLSELGDRRIRTYSNNERKTHDERSQDAFMSQQKMKTSMLAYDTFCDPTITLPDVPLKPLSRPGSAECIDKSNVLESRVYGISTGLVRKPPPLTSISGSRMDQEANRRKSSIVRPWEINPEVLNTNEPSKQSRPVKKSLLPVIQLAPTSNKYKEKIINIAQRNSPAPEKFPKFNFSVNETRYVSSEPLSKSRSTRSNSEQSLSPTYPMPTAKAEFNQSDVSDNTLSRPRSDSEETISADEIEQKEGRHLSFPSNISHQQNDVSRVQSVPVNLIQQPNEFLRQQLFPNSSHNVPRLQPFTTNPSQKTTIASRLQAAHEQNSLPTGLLQQQSEVSLRRPQPVPTNSLHQSNECHSRMQQQNEFISRIQSVPANSLEQQQSQNISRMQSLPTNSSESNNESRLQPIQQQNESLPHPQSFHPNSLQQQIESRLHSMPTNYLQQNEVVSRAQSTPIDSFQKQNEFSSRRLQVMTINSSQQQNEVLSDTQLAPLNYPQRRPSPNLLLHGEGPLYDKKSPSRKETDSNKIIELSSADAGSFSLKPEMFSRYSTQEAFDTLNIDTSINTALRTTGCIVHNETHSNKRFVDARGIERECCVVNEIRTSIKNNKLINPEANSVITTVVNAATAVVVCTVPAPILVNTTPVSDIAVSVADTVKIETKSPPYRPKAMLFVQKGKTAHYDKFLIDENQTSKAKVSKEQNSLTPKRTNIKVRSESDNIRNLECDSKDTDENTGLTGNVIKLNGQASVLETNSDKHKPTADTEESKHCSNGLQTTAGIQRTESPDIYDDLKVHLYEEQSVDSQYDLYNHIEDNSSNELVNLTSLRDSPKTDVELFYTRSDSLEPNEQLDNLNVTANVDEEVSELNNQECSGNRSDASTPVMDEPVANKTQSNSSVFVPIRPELTHFTLPLESSAIENTSPGSSPEAHTPLLDEPEYNFEPIHVRENLKVDFLPYNKQPGFQSFKYDTAQKELTQNEAFESITPPSSPEELKRDENTIQGVPSNVTSTATPVAFPFSALALHVSRPASRAGSSCHSPDVHSFPNENELSIKSKRKSREPSYDELERGSQFQAVDSKRMQKRNYRKSGSQSSSSSTFSKSPEYEYRLKRTSLSPDGGEDLLNKRPRTS